MGISVYRRRGAAAQDEVIQDTSVAGESLSLLTATVDYISEHYMEDIVIEDLLRIGNMSESHYRRKFKEYFNTSPAEYINLVRIDHACELLTQTDDKIEDIAMRTGFQTTGAFTRNFKKLAGEREVIPLHKYSCLCSGIFMCISMRFSKK